MWLNFDFIYWNFIVCVCVRACVRVFFCFFWKRWCFKFALLTKCCILTMFHILRYIIYLIAWMEKIVLFTTILLVRLTFSGVVLHVISFCSFLSYTWNDFSDEDILIFAVVVLLSLYCWNINIFLFSCNNSASDA